MDDCYQLPQPNEITVQTLTEVLATISLISGSIGLVRAIFRQPLSIETLFYGAQTAISLILIIPHLQNIANNARLLTDPNGTWLKLGVNPYDPTIIDIG